MAAALCLGLLDGDERSVRRTAGIRWILASRLVSSGYEHDLGKGRCPEFEKCETCRLLVLDDIGNGDGGHKWLFEVLNERKERKLPVIATTGLTRRQLLEAPYGWQWARRLLERDGKMGYSLSAFDDKND